MTEYPIANMEYRLSFLYAVYPPDFEGFKTAEDLQNFNNFNAIGTGPFKINTFDKDKGILILDANKDYFDGAPAIDQIIFQKFDNADAMIQALKVGDIDVISEVPATAFETVKGFENVKAVEENGRYFNELIINSVAATNDPAPKRNPALEDPQVRLALATAINKKDLVDIVLQGLGAPGDTIVPPTLGGGFWHNPNIKDVAFDIAGPIKSWRRRDTRWVPTACGPKGTCALNSACSSRTPIPSIRALPICWPDGSSRSASRPTWRRLIRTA